MNKWLRWGTISTRKIKGIQKDLLINSLGETVTQLKLEVMSLKGGGA